MFAEWMIVANQKAFIWGACKIRPFHGTKQQWRDVANADLKSLNVSLKKWYELTMNRHG